MATERRRNMYPDNCSVCNAHVEANAGWLYSQVDGAGGRNRRYNRHGGWVKFVKCDRCHTLKVAHKNQLPENRPAPIVVPTIGIAELRAGHLCYAHEKLGNWVQPIARWVLADGRSAIIAYQAPISGEPTACTIDDVDLKYGDCRARFNGMLTPAAAREYNRICEQHLKSYIDFTNTPE